MPSFQMVAERCNDVFRSEKAGEARKYRELFGSTKTVAAIAREIDVATEQHENFLGGMPVGMAAALKALIAANLEREKPYGMQIVPFVGPEWEFTITEVAPTAKPESRGTISVMLRCPKL